MQTTVAVTTGRSVAVHLGKLGRQVGSPQSPPKLPAWLEAGASESQQASPSGIKPRDSANEVEKPLKSAAIEGVRYSLWVGAPLQLFSTAERETKLRSMHEPNHRELPIAKLAARVADVLWPRCQENVDEALAAAKEMSAGQRVVKAEPDFAPPSVPHFLPFTNWLRNSKEMQESFVCDANTRYKPRMSWYNPNDGMIPSGWLSEGLLADLAYYKPFVGTRAPEQRW